MKTKIEFTEDVLQSIRLAGMFGKTYIQLAADLGMTPDQLRDERYKTPELDKTLRDFEYNANQYYIERMLKAALENKKGFAADVYVEMYRYLIAEQKSF